MRMVIDALARCYAREHIDTFAIASGDSDFCPLAYKLRENNRLVTGLGVKEATSPLFVKACDEFIYLKPPRKEKAPPREEHEERATTPRAARGARGAASQTAPDGLPAAAWRSRSRRSSREPSSPARWDRSRTSAPRSRGSSGTCGGCSGRARPW